jgi:hypothetical protein
MLRVYVIKVVKLRNIRWLRHLSYMGKKGKLKLEKLKGKVSLYFSNSRKWTDPPAENK